MTALETVEADQVRINQLAQGMGMELLLAYRRAEHRAPVTHSPFGGRFGGSGVVPSGDCLPRWSRIRSLMRGWWLQTRLFFVDTRNRRRPLVPALLRSRALRRVA